MSLAFPISRGMTTVIDEQDAVWMRQYRWYANINAPGQIYVKGRVDRRLVALHRMVICAPTGVWVDHINGDTLDNRRANLRLATPSQNRANRKWRGSPAGFKGVRLPETAGGKFKAYIAVPLMPKTIYLGAFETAEEAAVAYDNAARAAHGGFAVVNFPRVGERGCVEPKA